MIAETKISSPNRSEANAAKRGFTLTEIAIVLGIIGLILGAIWAAASSVYANLKANQAQQGILAASQAVRSMYATSANTGQTTAGTILSPGMFPTNWQSTTIGVVGNPWHINPTANYAYVYGKGQVFGVEIDGISDAGCASLSGFYNQKAASSQGGSVPGLVGNELATTAVTAGTPTILGSASWPTAAAPNFPATPAGCNGGDLNDSFAVFFDMSIM